MYLNIECWCASVSAEMFECLTGCLSVWVCVLLFIIAAFLFLCIYGMQAGRQADSSQLQIQMQIQIQMQWGKGNCNCCLLLRVSSWWSLCSFHVLLTQIQIQLQLQIQIQMQILAVMFTACKRFWPWIMIIQVAHQWFVLQLMIISSSIIISIIIIIISESIADTFSILLCWPLLMIIRLFISCSLGTLSSLELSSSSVLVYLVDTKTVADTFNACKWSLASSSSSASLSLLSFYRVYLKDFALYLCWLYLIVA